ncbi:potassium transporter Kup [Corynebacterium frankenforstense]|uniref:potassium transporter Kup n=1 Tax=Corynebacterium frankenforstense TaxID=1230998 RepID=UPI0026EB863D|nr:KUP/HAK/KT family potassium transporter [Corynebacterium frankenforstense]
MTTRSGAHAVPRHGARLAAGTAALGVVFGDIGTSPLYVLRAVFTVHHGAVPLTDATVTGAVSALIWTVFLIVAVKYVLLVLRADNDGEGGVIALATLVRSRVAAGTDAAGRRRLLAALGGVGVFGAALFFGDAVITPAISVLSAVEGVRVAVPWLSNSLILPLALAVLTALFAAQRRGTEKVGRVFGPVMLVWFLTLAAVGVPQILARPAILAALSPLPAVEFILGRPLAGFFAAGALVLATTGAEALYADIAHFGRRPIQGIWFAVVLPALVLNYLGQGAGLLRDPARVADPFFTLVPQHFGFLLVLLATAATVIASQAVISGAFSVVRQAIRLGHLPRMRVVHTSERASGQVYIPAVTLLLYCAVVAVILIFRDSGRLSSAYGLAVCTDFLVTSTLLCLLTRFGWRWPVWASALLAVCLAAVELPLAAANAAKIATGGWLPLLIAAVLVIVMDTFRRGEARIRAARLAREGTLDQLEERLALRQPARIPGTVVYPHSLVETAPFSLLATTAMSRSLHQRVIVLSVRTRPVPHVPPGERLTVRPTATPGLEHWTVDLGFADDADVVGVLDAAGCAGRATAVTGAAASESRDGAALWVLSRAEVTVTDSPGMARWRKRLYVLLTRLAPPPQWTRTLPGKRCVTVSRRVPV